MANVEHEKVQVETLTKTVVGVVYFKLQTPGSMFRVTVGFTQVTALVSVTM